MKSLIRNEFLVSIENEFGQLRRIGKSNSLFGVQDKARLYVRYSKLHHSTGRHAPAASLSLIDVLWIHPTQNLLEAAFEVEHSTPIYSGLLRFNDVHIDFKLPRAGIIAQAERKDAFLQQINRRTFRASGLDQVCLFYNYSEVYRWYLRLVSQRQS